VDKKSQAWLIAGIELRLLPRHSRRKRERLPHPQ